MGDQAGICAHYNARPNSDPAARAQSRTIRLRNVHNFLKRQLILRYTRPGDTVLDIGVGKGGDLQKYRQAQISELYGVDIACCSILDATDRARDANLPYRVILKTRDAFAQPLDLLREFDIISCQFTFHYAWASETTLNTALGNIARHLRVGGHVLMTVPSKREILARAERRQLANAIYKIEPCGTISDLRTGPLFGNAYRYSLVDALDSCVEYLVDLAEQERRMRDLGLVVVEDTAFEEFLPEAQRAQRRLPLSRDELEVFRLYRVVVYRRQEIR